MDGVYSIEGRERLYLWGFSVLFLIIGVIPVSGYVADDPNMPMPAGVGAAPGLLASLNYPNAAYLVYNAGDGSVIKAMQYIGATNLIIRSNTNPVTSADWQACAAVIIGANDGTTSLAGISTADIESYTTGRVVLSGHDADLHAGSDIYVGDIQWAAQMFLIQSINYVMDRPGKGLVGFGDSDAGFGWTPASWGISYTQDFSEESVSSFTDAGFLTGIYANLTPALMSDWKVSFHVRLDAYSSAFFPLEMGHFGDSEGVITIACPVDPDGFEFSKVDDVDPNSIPGAWDEVVYTIDYGYPDPNGRRQALPEVRIEDHIPAGMEYVASSPAGSYNILARTVTWELGTLYPNASGSISLTVVVTEEAEPGSILHNAAVLRNDAEIFAVATEDTPVANWAGDVIYVDNRATGYNNGTSWANAYTDLQAAIARAEKGCGSQIWIAKGTYNPGGDVTASFTIPAGVSVYGGFAGTETEFNQRDIQANPTILSGDTGIFDNGTLRRNEKVVVMGNNTLLDGVTVKDGKLYGIYGIDGDFTIQYCNVIRNIERGIYTEQCNLLLKWSNIADNSYDGIYHYGNDNTILVENCVVSENKQNGINCRYSTPTIINSIIHHNGSDSSTNSLYYGIRLFQPGSRPVLRNNTIVCNTHAGIYYVNNSYGTLPKPQVKNSIVWHNAEDEGFVDIRGLNDIVRSCLTDPNDVYGIHPQADANGNLRSNPKFAYSDLSLGNFHLSADSPCVNAGDPNETATTEVDMDNQARIAGTSIEMGADEVDCEDVYNPLDWDADGLVNLKEFKAFSAAWLTIDPNHPNLPNPVEPNAILHWNPMCDLDSDQDVDMADLMVFVPEWCWSACWRFDISAMQQPVSAMMTQSGPIVSDSLSISSTDAISMNVESAESTETETTLTRSLLNRIDGLIETDQENAETWQEMKSLLEQSLLETEKTWIKTAEF